MKFVFFLCSWLTGFRVWVSSPFYLPTITFILTSFKTNFSHCAQGERKHPQPLSPSLWRPACLAAQIGRTKGTCCVGGSLVSVTPESQVELYGLGGCPWKHPSISHFQLNMGLACLELGPRGAPMPGQLPSPFRKFLLIITYRKQNRKHENSNSQGIWGEKGSLRKVCQNLFWKTLKSPPLQPQ